ncbi:serine/threonine-protein kinase [Streptomyces sp. NPDC059398]|uniref:serine/threonine-protein kinase n=1 Tax=Streptomyces sp. NPDC059398 TaxID=3346820 RepID=UPI0036996BB2
MPKQVGMPVGSRYRLAEPVGQGGMGRVWRAHDELLDREVAVKEVLLPAELTDSARQTLIRRSMSEARAAARLRHAGIVTVHDVVEDGEVPWIVMEFLPGKSLGTMLRRAGRLEWQAALAICVQVAEALAHAHATGVIHRDLKPEKILLVGDRAVVTDFGIARIVDATTQLTATDGVVGTPQYMSPEQLNKA